MCSASVRTQVFQGHEPSLAVDSGGRPGPFGDRPEDPRHLLPHLVQQGELLLQVAIVVAQRGREPGLIVADQERPGLRDHALHAVAVGLFAVDEMTDDLQRAPLARHRPCPELLGGHVGHGAAEQGGALEVGLDEVGSSRHGGHSREGWIKGRRSIARTRRRASEVRAVRISRAHPGPGELELLGQSVAAGPRVQPSSSGRSSARGSRRARRPRAPRPRRAISPQYRQ